MGSSWSTVLSREEARKKKKQITWREMLKCHQFLKRFNELVVEDPTRKNYYICYSRNDEPSPAIMNYLSSHLEKKGYKLHQGYDYVERLSDYRRFDFFFMIE